MSDHIDCYPGHKVPGIIIGMGIRLFTQQVFFAVIYCNLSSFSCQLLFFKTEMTIIDYLMTTLNDIG